MAHSLLDDLDRELGAVGLGKVGLFLQLRGYGTVVDLARIAKLVELEQFRSDRLAAIMPLTFVPVDANLQCCGFSHDRSPSRSAMPRQPPRSLAHAAQRSKDPSQAQGPVKPAPVR